MNRPHIKQGCAAPAGMGSLLVLLALLIGGCLPPIVPPDPLVVVPIPAEGFHVLLVYDTSAVLSAEQLGTIHGTKLATLLNTKCARGADGRPGWRVWEKGSIDEAGLAAESEVWRKIWASSAPQLTKLPAIVLVSGKTSRVVAMPETEADTIKLIVEAK